MSGEAQPEAKWVRFESVGPLGALISLLDAERNGIATYSPPMTHTVGAQPVGFAVVHPWLAEQGLHTDGVWTLEDPAFVSPVHPLSEAR